MHIYNIFYNKTLFILFLIINTIIIGLFNFNRVLDLFLLIKIFNDFLNNI